MNKAYSWLVAVLVISLNIDGVCICEYIAYRAAFAVLYLDHAIVHVHVSIMVHLLSCQRSVADVALVEFENCVTFGVSVDDGSVPSGGGITRA